MNWFLIALIGPVLWATVNHIDKYLLSDRFKGSNVGALMIFSSLQTGLVLPIFYFIDRNVINVSALDAVILVAVGVLSIFAIMPYMYALEEEEASIVVPLFQLIPLWGYLFSYLILDERLTPIQLIGSLFIIIGSGLITMEVDEENKIRFKRRIILLMLLSTVLFAFYETVFKLIAVDVGFVASTFWEHIGMLIMGIIFYITIKKYRESFLSLINNQGKKIFSLNIFSESLTIVGNIATNFAVIIAPVALVLTVSGMQPLFVFVIGVSLTLFFPEFHEEKLTKKHLAIKIISILIIVTGSVIINTV